MNLLTIITFGLYRPKFKLGSIQQKWIAALRAHPERQGKGILGWINESSLEDSIPYYACCLGEGGLIAGVCEWKDNETLVNTNNDTKLLSGSSYKRLGLYSGSGPSYNDKYPTLTTLNDSSTSWTKIADILEKHPKRYFKTSK